MNKTMLIIFSLVSIFIIIAISLQPRQERIKEHFESSTSMIMLVAFLLIMLMLVIFIVANNIGKYANNNGVGAAAAPFLI